MGEASTCRDHLLHLDRESRQQRFSGTVSDEFIARNAASTLDPGVVVHGCFIDGTVRGAAEFRPYLCGCAREDEAAFSVEQPWQSHGVGSVLLEHTLRSARNRGIKSV